MFGTFYGVSCILCLQEVDFAMNTLLYAALGTGFTFLMTALGAAAVFFVKGRRRKGALRLCLGRAKGHKGKCRNHYA